MEWENGRGGEAGEGSWGFQSSWNFLTIKSKSGVVVGSEEKSLTKS